MFSANNTSHYSIVIHGCSIRELWVVIIVLQFVAIQLESYALYKSSAMHVMVILVLNTKGIFLGFYLWTMNLLFFAL